MTAPPQPGTEQTDEGHRDAGLHPRDNRVLRDNHGNPLPGSEPAASEPAGGEPSGADHPSSNEP